MQKFNLREQVINSTMDSLKIDKNPFNYSTIEEFIDHIPDIRLKEFYSLLFGDKHTYLSGMDRIKVVADYIEAPRLRELARADRSIVEHYIQGVETMNTILFDEAKELKRVFEDYVRAYEFSNVCDSTKEIFNNVSPYFNIAELTINIHKYANGEETQQAFSRAIENTRNKEAIVYNNKIAPLIRTKRISE